MSDKRLVTFKVDPATLAPFDAWCKKRKTTRTDALTAYMVGVVSGTVAIKAQESRRDEKCVHPIGRRIDGQCAICGAKVGGK